jgi:hypothetical protein
MVNREKVDGKEVKAQLKALSGNGRPGKGSPDVPLNAQELAEARMPFQAAVAGEGVAQKRYVRGADRGLSEDAIYEKYGPVNGQIANAVIQRAEQAQGANPDGFGMRVERQRNMDPGPTADIGPDPWNTPVGTGNGITQERVKRSSASTKQTPLLAASPPSKEYTFGKNIKPDGPNDYRTNVRAEADYRQAVRNLGRVRGYGRNAAIAGGAVAGLAGLDGLINGERNKREEEQYR